MGCGLFRTEELTRIQLALLRWKKGRVWRWKVTCLQKRWRKIRCFSEIDFEISHSSLQNNCLARCHLSLVRQKFCACHLIWAENSLESLGFFSISQWNAKRRQRKRIFCICITRTAPLNFAEEMFGLILITLQCQSDIIAMSQTNQMTWNWAWTLEDTHFLYYWPDFLLYLTLPPACPRITKQTVTSTKLCLPYRHW